MGTNLPQKPSEHILSWVRNNLIIDSELGIVRSIRTRDEVGSTNTSGGYCLIWCSEGKYLKRAHLVWWNATEEWPALQLDHGDRNEANDRLDNLAPKTNRQNCYNRGPSLSRDLPIGVYKANYCERYHAKIMASTQIFLGSYALLEDAISARKDAEILVEQEISFSTLAEFRLARARMNQGA